MPEEFSLPSPPEPPSFDDAVPSGILSEPRKMTEEDVREIRARWAERLIGEHGPELTVIPTGRTIRNVERRNRTIE